MITKSLEQQHNFEKMPKIFVLRNRLQEQQARLLETQKGQQIKIRSDELSTDGHLNQQHRHEKQENHGGYEMQDEPVALIVDRKSDITAAVAAISLTATTTSDKDNCQPAPPCQQQTGKITFCVKKTISPFSLIDLPRIRMTVHSGGTTRMRFSFCLRDRHNVFVLSLFPSKNSSFVRCPAAVFKISETSPIKIEKKGFFPPRVESGQK